MAVYVILFDYRTYVAKYGYSEKITVNKLKTCPGSSFLLREQDFVKHRGSTNKQKIEALKIASYRDYFLYLRIGRKYIERDAVDYFDPNNPLLELRENGSKIILNY